MRKAKQHQQGRKYVHHSIREKRELLKAKRKRGSALRRRTKRHEVLKTLECGCKKTRVRMETCPEHTAKLDALIDRLESHGFQDVDSTLGSNAG